MYLKFRKEKLLLMSWCPDTARIKKKMLYSSSFDALKKALVGVQKYFQVQKLLELTLIYVKFNKTMLLLPGYR